MLAGAGGCKEEDPASDAHVQTFALEVEPAGETVLVNHFVTSLAEFHLPTQTLYAVDPHTGATAEVAQLDDLDMVRVVPGVAGLLVAGAARGKDEVRYYAPGTWELRGTETQDVCRQIGSLRLSPSGRYVAACGRLYDLEVGCSYRIDLGADDHGFQGVFLHGTDELVAVASPDPASSSGWTNVYAWDIPSVAEAGFGTGFGGGGWDAPDLEVLVPGVVSDPQLVAVVDASDHYAVFPTNGGAGLIVVGLEVKRAHALSQVRGPVTFIPDQAAFLAHAQGGSLVRVDAETGRTEDLLLPVAAGTGYSPFVRACPGSSRLGLDLGSQIQRLLVYDAATGAVEELTDPRRSLSFSVPRPGHAELWAVDGGLYRLDLDAASLDAVEVPDEPTRIAALPKADLLAVDELGAPELHLVSPQARGVEKTITVPLRLWED